MKICSVKGCSKSTHAHGMCNAHAKKEYRKQFPDSDKKYEKTVDGFLMRAYRNIKSRCEGIQYKKAHLYKGLPYLDKETFYSWAKNSSQFQKLYKEWVMCNYDRKLTPSVNRIDSNKGYLTSNIEWITHSQNSALSSVTKKLKGSKEKIAAYKALGVKINEKNQ